eukprot:3131445-Amphidinium_carterae.1
MACLHGCGRGCRGGSQRDALRARWPSWGVQQVLEERSTGRNRKKHSLYSTYYSSNFTLGIKIQDIQSSCSVASANDSAMTCSA